MSNIIINENDIVTNIIISGSTGTTTLNNIIIGTKDIYVTGGTHNLSGGTTTFTNNFGGQFDVTGYFSGFSYTAENVANKQNNMDIDLTNEKYPTVTAVNKLVNNIARATLNTGFLSTNDAFTLYPFDDFTLGISGSSVGILFEQLLETPPFAPSDAIVQLTDRTIPLSAIGLTIDGNYVQFVGYRQSDDSILFSDNSFHQTPTTCQLGLVLVKVSGGTTSFIDFTRNVVNKPDIAGYSNLETTAIDMFCDVAIAPAETNDLHIQNSNGALVGISVNWHGVNNDLLPVDANSATTFTYLTPLSANTFPIVSTDLIDPTQYFSGTTLVPLAFDTNASVQRFLVTVKGTVVVQYGERQYNTLEDAKNGIFIENFTDALPDGCAVEIGRMALVKSATTLTDSSQAFFITAGQGGGGSTSATVSWGQITGDITAQTDLVDYISDATTGSVNAIPKFDSTGLTDSNITDDGNIVSIQKPATIHNSLYIHQGFNGLATSIGIGTNTLAANNPGGNYQTAVGFNSLVNIAGGDVNTAVGANALRDLIVGQYNVAVGANSLTLLSFNSRYNTALGTESGFYTNGFGGFITSSNYSTFIGYETKALTSNPNNVTVIGALADARGGDDTMTFGNLNIIDNFFRGYLNTNAGYKIDGGLSTQFLMADGSTSLGASIFGTPLFIPRFNATGDALEDSSITDDGLGTVSTTSNIFAGKYNNLSIIRNDSNNRVVGDGNTEIQPLIIGGSNVADNLVFGDNNTGGLLCTFNIVVGNTNNIIGRNNTIVIGNNIIPPIDNTVNIGDATITDNYFNGNIQGGAFIKYGGLPTEFLMADGSVTTGGAAFTGTTNFIQKLDANSNLTNSLIYDNGIGLGIATTSTASTATTITFGSQSNRTIAIEDSNNVTVGRDLIIKGGKTINFNPNLPVPGFVGLTAGAFQWQYIAVNPVNGDVYVTVNAGDIYKRIGGVGPFVGLGQTARQWTGIAINHNTGDVYAAVSNGDIYKQTGSVGNFIAQGQTSRLWNGIGINTTNNHVYATVSSGDIYRQANGVGAFVAQGAGTRNWSGIAVNSTTGDVFAAVNGGGDIYKQTAGSGAFSALLQTGRNYFGITVNSTNGDVYAAVNGGDIYKFNGGTGNLIALGQASLGWRGIAVNSSNGNLYAVVNPVDIYFSTAFDVGTVDLNGGKLQLKAGTGKGAGQSRIELITGLKQASGATMQPERVAAIIDEDANLTVVGNIIKSGGTASQILLANGSTTATTAFYSGAVTVNFIPKVTGAGIVANSRMRDDSFAIGIDTQQPLSNDLQFGYLPANRTICIEDSNATSVGKDLIIKAGKANNVSGATTGVVITGATASWFGLAVNAITGDVYAAANNGDIYKQTNGTGPLVALGQTARNWQGLAINNVTKDVYAVVFNGDIYKQTAGVGNFIALGQTTRQWNDVEINQTTGDVYALVYQGDLYKQSGGTGNFITMSTGNRDWTCMGINSTNGDIYAGGFISDVVKLVGGVGPVVNTGMGTGIASPQGMTVNSANGDVYACSGNGTYWKQTGSNGLFNQITFASVGVGRSITVNPSTYDIFIGSQNSPNTVTRFPNNFGTANLNGGTLNLKAGLGKGTGQSRIQLTTGQQTVSGSTGQTEVVRVVIDESGNTTFNGAIIGGQVDSLAQIEIGTSTTVQESWKGKLIFFTANCTITIPATLTDNFAFQGVTLAGVTITWAITPPKTWLFGAPSPTPEKTTFSITQRGSSNDVLYLG